VLADFIAD
jgi:ribonuclease HI